MGWVVKEVNARVLEKATMQSVENERAWKVGQLFADDITLVTDSNAKLQKLVTEFGRLCGKKRNVNNCKVIIFIRVRGQYSWRVRLN